MNRENQNLEYFLYQVIEELSKEDAPIIFKGGLALKDLLFLVNENINVDRKTIDIDANWVDKYNKEKITKVLEKAVKKVNRNYNVVLYREPDINKSMGFKVVDEKNNLITKIDLDVKDNPFYIICNINDVDIKYSSLEKMMADKIFVLSNTHIFRRIKDILDVYLIISNCNIDIEKVNEILKYDKRELGDFSTLLSNKQLIKESYDKLIGVKNKPDFEKVWNTTIKYLEKNKFLK